MLTYANEMDKQPYEYKRLTLAKVLSDKLVVWVSTNRVSKLLSKILELLMGLFLGAIAIAPKEIMAILSSLLGIYNYAIPKGLLVTLLFMNRKQIFRFVKKYIGRPIFVPLSSLIVPSRDDKLLDGIPIVELTDYLIRNKHFKREGVNGVRETFGLNMERFNKLANRFEQNGVLIRGENNSRVLDPKWSRQLLIDYLSDSKRSIDMQPHFHIRRISDNTKVRLDNTELSMAQ